MTTLLSSMRAGNYRQAVALADRVLVPELGRKQDITDAAIHAMNACAKYAKTGKLALQYTPQGSPVIKVKKYKGGDVQLPSVDELLRWVEPNSALEYLSMASGISRVVTLEASPF